MGAEDFLQGLDGKFGEGMDLADPSEWAVSNERVDVGMKIKVFAKGVEGKNDGWMSLGFTEWRTETKGEALMGCGAEMFEERTAPLEVSAEHIRQSEDSASVRATKGGKRTWGQRSLQCILSGVQGARLPDCREALRWPQSMIAKFLKRLLSLSVWCAEALASPQKPSKSPPIRGR